MLCTKLFKLAVVTLALTVGKAAPIPTSADYITPSESQLVETNHLPGEITFQSNPAKYVALSLAFSKKNGVVVNRYPDGFDCVNFKDPVGAFENVHQLCGNTVVAKRAHAAGENDRQVLWEQSSIVDGGVALARGLKSGDVTVSCNQTENENENACTPTPGRPCHMQCCATWQVPSQCDASGECATDGQWASTCGDPKLIEYHATHEKARRAMTMYDKKYSKLYDTWMENHNQGFMAVISHDATHPIDDIEGISKDVGKLGKDIFWATHHPLGDLKDIGKTAKSVGKTTLNLEKKIDKMATHPFRTWKDAHKDIFDAMMHPVQTGEGVLKGAGKISKYFLNHPIRAGLAIGLGLATGGAADEAAIAGMEASDTAAAAGDSTAERGAEAEKDEAEGAKKETEDTKKQEAEDDAEAEKDEAEGAPVDADGNPCPIGSRRLLGDGQVGCILPEEQRGTEDMTRIEQEEAADAERREAEAFGGYDGNPEIEHQIVQDDPSVSYDDFSHRDDSFYKSVNYFQPGDEGYLDNDEQAKLDFQQKVDRNQAEIDEKEAEYNNEKDPDKRKELMDKRKELMEERKGLIDQNENKDQIIEDHWKDQKKKTGLAKEGKEADIYQKRDKDGKLQLTNDINQSQNKWRIRFLKGLKYGGIGLGIGGVGAGAGAGVYEGVKAIENKDASAPAPPGN